MFLSEFIFIIRQNSSISLKYYLLKSQVYANKGQLGKSLTYLQKAVEYKIKIQKQQYPDLIPANFEVNVNILPENTELRETYLKQLQEISPKEFIEENPPELSRLTYLLGLQAYLLDEVELIPSLWQASIYMAPQWSYFHVELANYYLSENEPSQAQEAIRICRNFEFSKDHCHEYMINNLQINKPLKVGFWKDLIFEKINN
jgi:hypothetical protein